MIGTLEDIRRDMEHGVYDFTKDGKCSGCGQCCSNMLPMSEKEAEDIRRYIKKHNIKEQKHSYPAPLAHPPEMDLTCPFLDESKEKDKCLIYEKRPEICRVFICNQPPSEAQKKINLEEFWARRKPALVRETFFGNN